MRSLVFLLILANLLFFIWSQDYLGLSQNPDAFRVRQQLQAEKVRIASNDTPPPADTPKNEKTGKPAEKPMTEPVAAAAPPVEVCVQLSDVPPAEAERLEGALAEKLPALKTTRTTTPGTTSYWVHIPPAKTRRDAENSAADLRQQGIRDFFIVQENGPNNLAISLGLFSTRESAASALEMFRNRGVRLAKVAERIIKPPVSQLEIRGPDSVRDDMNQLIAQHARDAKRGTCKLRPA